MTICDPKGNIIAPPIFAPGNRNDCILLKPSMIELKKIAKTCCISLKGIIMSLDGVFDSKENRKYIYNSGMKPNIPENKRNRKKPKLGRKRIFCEKIFAERFRTIERCFSWEDKFKRLVLRFETISSHHYCMKIIALSMINLRHYCN